MRRLPFVLVALAVVMTTATAYAEPVTDIGVLPPSQPAPPYPPPQYQQPQYQQVPQYQLMPPPYQAEPYVRRRPYREGDPIPPGYHVEDKPRQGLVVAGWVLLLVPYAIGAFAGIAAKFENQSTLLLAPVLGPWLTLGARKYNGCNNSSSASDALGCTGDVFVVTGLILAGAMQAAGTTLLLVGYLNTKEELVRDDRALRLRPMKVGTGYGLGLGSAF